MKKLNKLWINQILIVKLHKLWAIYETAKILTSHPQYLTKTLSCIIPITMLLRVFETPLLNILLGLRPLFTPSDFWWRHSQHSHADTDFNATDLELSYRFSINHISIKWATFNLITNHLTYLNYPKHLSANYKAISM